MRSKRTMNQWLTLGLLAAGFMVACDPVEPEETNARFNAVQDENDFLSYTFENVSTGTNNTYAWDFGDGTTSEEESPSHTYAEAGEYDVTLVATGDAGASTLAEPLLVADPLAQQKDLAGETSKTWKLIREGASLWIGPEARTDTWFSLTNLALRPCMANDEWIFSLDAATMEYNSNGDIWAEAGVWPEAVEETCLDITDPNAFTGANGDDLSAWGDGTHDYVYDPDAGTLTVTGTGAFIALPKVATNAEVTTPQSEVTYEVVKLVNVENGVDTLVVSTLVDAVGGRWEFTLVSYDNPADEPELESNNKPIEENDIFDDFSDAGNSNIAWTTDQVTGWATGVANPDAGETFLVGQYDKGASSPYENLQVTFDYIMDLSTRNVFTIRAYFPSSNDYTTVDPGAQDWADPKTLAKTVSIKLQNSSLGDDVFTTQAEIKHTIADENLDSWVDLIFDFSTIEGLVDREDLDRIVIQLGGEGQSQTGTFYIADFMLNE